MTLTNDELNGVTAHNEGIWNRCAPTYAEVFEPLTGAAAPALLDLAGVGRSTELLDIGTGPGTLIGPALDRGATVVAVDLAPEMVAVATARHPGVDITVGNAASLPFADHSCDAVTIGFCLHHAADPDAVLREGHRVLRPGGRLAFTVWASADQLEAFGTAFAVVAEIIPPEEQPQSPQPPVIGTEPADYEDALTRAGFSHPTARILALEWAVTDGATMFDGFARFLDLGGHDAGVRARIRRRLDEVVLAKAGSDGVARLRNPAILAGATKT
jgi:SAM-dependent methyltransferase